MTIQEEQATSHAATPPARTRHLRRGIVAALAIAAGGTVAGIALASGGDHPRPPQPVLGQSLMPLTVYSVAVPQSSRPAAGQQLVPELGHPGHSALLSAKPV